MKNLKKKYRIKNYGYSVYYIEEKRSYVFGLIKIWKQVVFNKVITSGIWSKEGEYVLLDEEVEGEYCFIKSENYAKKVVNWLESGYLVGMSRYKIPILLNPCDEVKRVPFVHLSNKNRPGTLYKSGQKLTLSNGN